MDDRNLFIKAYASIGSGIVGRDIFSEYFPFLATVLIEEQINEISFNSCAEKITNKFHVKFSPSLVQMIVNEAVAKGLLSQSVNNVCYSDPQILQEYVIDFAVYEKDLDMLVNAFLEYSKNVECSIDGLDVKKYIEEMVDQYSLFHIMPKVEFSSESSEEFGPESPEYLQRVWQQFVLSAQDDNPVILDIVVRISVAASKCQALFYSGGEVGQALSGLSVYFDTSFIMHLIGADGEKFEDTARELLEQTIKSGCKAFVYQHTLDEVRSIMESVKHWTFAPVSEYRPDYANEATIFFRYKKITEFELDEFIEEIEKKLEHLNISIDKKLYSDKRESFRLSEADLLEEYRKCCADRYDERYHSIRIDVKSIIGIESLRGAQWNCQRVRDCKYVFVTSSSLMVRISKKYQRAHTGSQSIPQCISQEVFGAMVWLSRPAEFLAYEEKNLIASCYSTVSPSLGVREKFWQIVEEQRESDEIDPEKFLTLRAFPKVNQILLDVTRGDISLVDAGTPQKVYESIKDVHTAPLRAEIAKKDIETATVLKEKEDAEKKLHEVTSEAEEKNKRQEEKEKTEREAEKKLYNDSKKDAEKTADILALVLGAVWSAVLYGFQTWIDSKYIHGTSTVGVIAKWVLFFLLVSLVWLLLAYSGKKKFAEAVLKYKLGSNKIVGYRNSENELEDNY